MKEFEGWLGPCVEAALPVGRCRGSRVAGREETRRASRAQILLPDDYCPKASSLACVVHESGLRVAEDVLDPLR